MPPPPSRPQARVPTAWISLQTCTDASLLGTALLLSRAASGTRVVPTQQNYLHLPRRMPTLRAHFRLFQEIRISEFCWHRFRCRLLPHCTKLFSFVVNRVAATALSVGNSSSLSYTSSLNRHKFSASRFYRCAPGGKAHSTHWIGGWVGLRTRLDPVKSKKG